MINSKNQIPKPKIKLAIFDLTDCEGCELQFLAKKIEIEKILSIVEIVDFRLLEQSFATSKIDIALVEGTPLTKKDLDRLYKIREKSEKLVAFGTCAVTGGIASGLSRTERIKYSKKIYTKKYILKHSEALPLSNYVKVDLMIPGCPVDPVMVSKLLYKIINLGWFESENYPVCQECKENGNKCLLLEGKVCFGPIIMAGCNSACPNNNFGCLGCLGIWKEGNFNQFFKLLQKNRIPKDRIKQLAKFYLENDEIVNKALRSYDV